MSCSPSLLTLVDSTIHWVGPVQRKVILYAMHWKNLRWHNCRDNFLHALAHDPLCQQLSMSKRDLSSNINFFMNVPVTEEGGLEFVDGISAPGKYVEMQAEMDVVVIDLKLPATQQSLQRL